MIGATTTRLSHTLRRGFNRLPLPQQRRRHPRAGYRAAVARTLTRRELVVAGAGAAGLLALGGVGLSRVLSDSDGATEFVLRPQPETIELGGRTADTWTYGAGVPGPEIRLKQGERVRVRVENGLPEDTTVHWHGVRVAERRRRRARHAAARRSSRAGRSPTSSPRPTRARTGSTRTSACSSTAGSTAR